MKILFFGEASEEVVLLTNILNTHFKKNILVSVSDERELIDVLSYDGPFGFVVIDCTFKASDPNEVYETILGFIGDRPCLFMGTQSIVNDRVEQEVFERLEENDVLISPLDSNIEQLKNKLAICLKWAQDQEYEQSIEEINKEEFIGMKIKSFYLYNSFAYDLYVEVTSTKLLKAISKNSFYTQGDIQRYVKKGIKRFYIKKDDQLNFLEKTIRKCLEQIEVLPSSVDLMKTHIIAFSVIQNYVTNFGVTESIQNLTEALIDSIPYICRDRSLPEIFKDFPFGDAGIATKSVLIAYICEIILNKMEWNARSSKAKMTISSILHDIFLENDDLSRIKKLDDKNFELMSSVERDDFIKHPMKAARIANQFAGHSDIDYIIEQHHELPNGEGFPLGCNSLKLSVLSCIFITSYNFTNIISGFDLKPSNARKVIRHMIKSFNTGNFKGPMKILAEIFNVKF